MNKEFAKYIQKHALHSIEHLTLILHSPDFDKCSPELQERLKRSIGTLIGETDVTVLKEVYTLFPEMDDLK